MRRSDKLRLVGLLSLPAMMGQLSSIIMQYIDAMMVGHLGASASASIGLVNTTMWLFGGLSVSIGTGFCVLVAQHIGAKQNDRARDVLRQALLLCLAFSFITSAFCASIHHVLPIWLGGQGDVVSQASSSFLIWSLTIPVMQMYHLSNGMLRCAGNMTVPMGMGILMCALDVGLNCILIPRYGVTGAAMATSSSAIICATISTSYLLLGSPELRLRGAIGRLRLEWDIIKRALRIGLPMAVEHIVFCGAQIVSTLIVAPLGTVAIAANTIGITVESLCYMPGYGIGEAATTLIGQSVGAKRYDLVNSFSILTMATGMTVMTLLGIVMYIFAPELMAFMSIDTAVQALGTEALHIEAYAEPMYAASIVAYGIFVGVGDTLIPCTMNLLSIWLVRIPLAWLLASRMGLQGVWLAMCIELCVRGLIFIIRLRIKKPKKIEN